MLISKSLVSKARRDVEPLPGAPCEWKAAVCAVNDAALDSLECRLTRSSGNTVQGCWVLNKGQEPKGCQSGTSGYPGPRNHFFFLSSWNNDAPGHASMLSLYCRSGLLAWHFRVLAVRQPCQGGSSYQEAPVPSLLISRAPTPSLWTFEDI